MTASNEDGLIAVRFEGGRFGFAYRRQGQLIRLKRWFHILDNEDRRRAFRWRQIELLAGSVPWLIVGLSVAPWALAVFVALITCARDEALRFRTTGQTFQTRRALWVAATPHDRAHRHLLNGWQP